MGILRYLMNSNFKTSQDWNPFVWGFKYYYEGPSYLDPKLHMWYIRILFLSITIVIDDGSFRFPEPEIEDLEFIHSTEKEARRFEKENPYG